MEPLNIDWTQDGIEDKLEQLKSSIISKLTDGLGYQLQDDTLSTWIILIAVRQNKPKNEIQQDLVEFIGENSNDFVEWLWLEVPKLWNIPKIELKITPQKVDNKVPKDAQKSNLNKKSQSVFNNSSSQQASVIKDKTEEQKLNNKFASKSNLKSQEDSLENSNRLIKKAIGDTAKYATKGADKQFGKEKSTSYVTTNKEGRKIIHLSKSKNEEKGDEQLDKYKNKEYEPKQAGKGDVFQRLKPKVKDDGKKSSNLDVSLDSVIKKQKEHENEHNSRNWNQGPRKRNFYEVTEESYESKPFNKRQKHEEGDEAEEDGQAQQQRPKFSNARAAEGEGGEAGEGDKEVPTTGGYKGKKKNPYYAGGMPYMHPSAMYGYGYNPMYAMDPYMMRGYFPPVPGFKKFKNKSLIINKSGKSKAATVQKTEEEAGK